jgi:nondiscriminating aspartyl-tRNA synthetase
VLAQAQVLPFEVKNLNVSLPVLLDWRPLAFKNENIRKIFHVQEIIANSFRQTLKSLDFFEFQAPTIVPANAEGGAAVFHIDYYDSDAYLAQSPQLYKQIMVGGFERVFTVAKVFRAEPSVTTRHLAEYTSLDAEMGFISSWEDLMETCQAVMKTVIANLEGKYQIDLPKISDNIPRIKMREAQEIIFQRTERDHRKEPDLAPEDEKDICEYAKEKYNSDFIFITHYPVKKRPFYTFADPQDPDYTLSFDLLCRGLEIVTGGQRINQCDQLVANIKKWGNKPEDFEYYPQAFKYGLPPEGGFAIGLERLTKQILGLENIREACAFPRDMERIDQRLSAPIQKKKTVKKKTKK